MAKESIESALKRFDERYYKLRLDNSMLENFGTNLGLYIQSIKSAILNNESEEHLKNITNSFLKICFYQNNRFGINTYKRADSAITCDGVLYAMNKAGREPAQPISWKDSTASWSQTVTVAME